MGALSRIEPAAQAPAALSLELFTDLRRMPLSIIVHLANDNRNAPLIQHGDIVVVDTGGSSITGGWYPTDGGLFLIEYSCPPMNGELYARRSRQIVQTFIGRQGQWFAGGLRRGIQGMQMFCVDGPYRDEIALAHKLIGRVIGLYRGAAA